MTVSSFQTLTLEYRVGDRFDGATLAPPFSEGKRDARNVFVFEVARLGLIPFAFADNLDDPPPESSPAPVFLTWMLLRGLSAMPGAQLWVGVKVADLDPLPILPVGGIAAGSEGLYLRRCVKIPQGGLLVVQGVDAPPGAPAVLRVRVQVPGNSEQRAFLDLACCCKAELLDINVPDGDDPPSPPCPPDLALIVVAPPGPVPPGLTPIPVTLTGAGFSQLENVFVAFRNTLDSSTLLVTNIQVLDDNTITCDVRPQDVGTYDVIVGDPNEQLNCFVLLPGAFVVQSA